MVSEKQTHELDLRALNATSHGQPRLQVDANRESHPPSTRFVEVRRRGLRRDQRAGLIRRPSQAERHDRSCPTV